MVTEYDHPSRPERMLAERLRDLREREYGRLTQKQLADVLGGAEGLSPATVSMWENPRSDRLPPLPRLAAYARLFCTNRSFASRTPRLLRDDELTEQERKREAELYAELVELRGQALVERIADSDDEASTTRVDDLIQRGRSQGHLSLAELRTAFDQAGLTPAEGRSILRELSEAGVRLANELAENQGVPKSRSARSAQSTDATAAPYTTRDRYGAEFYEEIGRKGGQAVRKGDRQSVAAVRLSQRLRDLREREYGRLTQKQLANVLSGAEGLSPAAVSMWENPGSDRLPPLPRLAAYARLFCTNRSFASRTPRLLGHDELTEQERKREAELHAELVALREQAQSTDTTAAPYTTRDRHGARYNEEIGRKGGGQRLSQPSRNSSHDWRVRLTNFYEAQLRAPVVAISPSNAHSGLVIPSLAEAYVSPHLRSTTYRAGAQLEAESWWHGIAESGDAQSVLQNFLASPDAAKMPFVILGDAGSGKSLLTKILAARLPSQDFAPVRVQLQTVSTEAAYQDQIESVVRTAIGENINWQELRPDGNVLTVVMLDGLRNSGQAVGKSWPDYFERVIEFQRREAALGRPVAVIVTSRIDAAEQLRFPEGMLVGRLEPFNEDQIAHWLHIWNDINRDFLESRGLYPLSAERVLANRDLAENPSILFMLALYHANSNEVPDQPGRLAGSDLFETLLSSFSRNEVNDLLRDDVSMDTLMDRANLILESGMAAKRPTPDGSEDRRQADLQETEAAQLIISGQLRQARYALISAIEHDPIRQPRIIEEFGFILGESHESSPSSAWVSGLWSMLAAKSPMRLESSSSVHQVSTLSVMEDEAEDKEPTRSSQNATAAAGKTHIRSSQASGDALERAFLAVLTRLFVIDPDNIAMANLRRQQAGSQYGHDIQFDCVRSDRDTTKCHVECKNKAGYIRPADVAEKILQTSFHWREKKLDYLIFIAPRASLSNELDLMLQSLREARTYPFEVQVWARDSGISELFALEPEAHQEVYGSPPLSTPSDEVLERWRDRLKPICRVPSTIQNYLMDPARHCLGGIEDSGESAELYGSHVRIRGANALGTPVGDLEKVVRDWLEEAGTRSLLLLGEFGDGKSFFGYTLTRKLAEEYLENPESGWLSIRLSLADLPNAGDGRELLQRRLRDIGSSYADWLSAEKEARTLVILDGLDEMSVKIDPSTVADNLRLLSSCVQNLPAAKIVITSRTHIFEGRRQRDRFLEKLQSPTVLRLMPISRTKRIEHLNTFAKKARLQDKLLKLRRLYDPIGLAAKPLFLQMMKEVLAYLPDDEFSQLILYDTYVDKSLRRKIEFLEDYLLQASYDEIVDGLTVILEQVALKLHVEGRESLDLKAFARDGRSGNLSQLLWQMTGDSSRNEREEEDVRARVRIRSLLKQSEDGEADSWPVAFFHRSMREYFVARAISRAIRESPDNGREILRNAVLRPEITSFLVAMMEGSDHLREIKIRLESYARSAVRGSRSGHLGGNALTLLFRLPGGVSWRSWNGLDLDDANLSNADLSGMDFSQSSLCQAVMDNANLTATDLRGCDLTGVRLEETAPVVSLGAGRSEALFLAGYGDGTIREWSTMQMDRSPDSLAEPFVGLQSVGWGPGNCLVVLADRHVSILKEIKGIWHNISRFRMRTDISGIRVAGSRVSVIREAMAPGATGALSVLDCRTKQLILDAPIEGQGPFAVVDDFAIALPIAVNKVAIKFLADSDPDRWKVLPIEDVSAVALHRSGDDNLYIVAGTANGWIFIFRAGTAESRLEFTTVREEHVHQAAVTSICFLSDELFVSGGVDRQVAVHEVGSAAARTVHRLQLTISCAGVRTEGISGPVERIMFDHLREAGRLD